MEKKEKEEEKGGRGGEGGPYDEMRSLKIFSVCGGGGVSRHKLSELRSAVLNLNRRHHGQLTSKILYL